MKETATTTGLGSIGQITEDRELIVDVHAEDEIVGKADTTVSSKSNANSFAKSDAETVAEAYGDDREDDEIVDSYADSWSYEVPRPWLTVEQAASMLGRSARGVERSILGRWGNHLPEGWSARRVRIDGIDEWRIIPPPGFRIKHSRRETTRRESANDGPIDDVEMSPLSASDETGKENKTVAGQTTSKSQEKKMASPAIPTSAATQTASASASSANAAQRSTSAASSNEPFSFEKFFQSAGKMAQKELASFGLSVRPTSERGTSLERAGAVDADVEHATIVIDRSDEVEKLLRELADTQKELSEQRRMHLDDLRLMQEMQRSMLLLEVHAKETGELKQDLTYAQQALKEHRSQYQAFLALPWYKRLFTKSP
ncbi:hypothetical protein BH11CYA1_BH11CYA1_29120 [soil metagenome]